LLEISIFHSLEYFFFEEGKIFPKLKKFYKKARKRIKVVPQIKIYVKL